MESGEGNEKAWVIGEEREITGDIKLCQRGYHSSPSWLDALEYAPGNIACIVEVSKLVDKDSTKQVSSRRKLIDARNAEHVLREFTCDCAERALRKAKVKDEQSWNAIKVSRLYNKGEATKEERDAAWDATRAAAKAAAWYAAEIRWQKRHLNKLMARLFNE